MDIEMSNICASSNENGENNENEFIKKLREERGALVLNKLLSKIHYGKRIDWMIIHKYVKESSFNPALFNNSMKSCEEAAKFKVAYLKYLNEVGGYESIKNIKNKEYFLRRSYINSKIHSFVFNHERSNADIQNNNETILQESQDTNLKNMIEHYLKIIENQFVVGNKVNNDIFNFIKRIRDKMAEADNIPLPELKKILLFGRNGSGKSTLINFILFATVFHINNLMYAETNMSIPFGNFEAIKYAESLLSEEQAEAMKFSLSESWDILHPQGVDDNFNDNRNKVIDNSDSPFEINDFRNFLSQDGSWNNNNEYKLEMKKLKILCSPTKNSIQLAVHPFILPSAIPGSQSSCTNSTIYIRYGSRWQVVITLSTFDDILNRFDEKSKDATMKWKLYNLLCSLPNKIQQSHLQNSSSSSVSNSKKVKHNNNNDNDDDDNDDNDDNNDNNDNNNNNNNSDDDEVDDIKIASAPNSRKEAEEKLPSEVKEFLQTKQGFILIGYGKDIHADRMFIRQRMMELIETFDSIINNIILFSPSILLKDNNICLVDAPGDDDMDWNKGKQLNQASQQADAVIIMSRRDIHSGVSLDTFAKLFSQRIFKGSKPFKIFLALREVPELVTSLQDIQDLQKPKKSMIKVKSLLQFRESFTKIIKMITKNPEERSKLEEMRKNLEINGGHFIYMWAALNAIGNDEINEQDKQKIFEESGYNELITFLSSISPKGQNDNHLKESYIIDILKLIEEMEKMLNEDTTKDIETFITDQLKIDDDSKLYYDFKEQLSIHPTFYKLVNKEQVDVSNKNFSNFKKDIDFKCSQIADDLSLKIQNEINGENKNDICQRILRYWDIEDISNILTIESPDIPYNEEYRLFAELVAPLIVIVDFEELTEFFHSIVIDELIKCAHDAILKHIIKNYVKSASWRDQTTIKSTQLAKDYEGKLKEGIEMDSKLKNICEYITNISQLPFNINIFRNKIDAHLYRANREFMKENKVLNDAKKAIKTHLYIELQKRISGDINAEMILDNIIDIMNEKNLKKVLINSINKTYLGVLKSLFNAFIIRNHQPILKIVVNMVFNKPLPIISQEKKTFIMKTLDSIKRECNNSQTVHNLSMSTST